MDNKNLYRLVKYIHLYKKDFIIVMISLICVSLSLLMIGRGFRLLVDKGFNDVTSINQSLSFICALVAVLSVGSFFRSYFINNVAEKIINQIRKEVYNNLIHQEIIWFEELKIGDVIARLTSDIELISKLIINFFSFFIRNLLMFIGGIILMFLENYKLALIIVVIIPILLIPLTKFSKYVRSLSRRALESQSLIVTNIEESFVNIRAIHSFNQEGNKISGFDKQIAEYLDHSSSRLKIRALFFSLSIAIILMSIIIVIWIGSIDILKGNLSPGQLISFIYYAVVAGASSGGIFELLSEIHSPLAALQRVFEISGDTRVALTNNINDLDKASRGLELKNISFAYPSHPELLVLNNISFVIEPGQFIGIVGRSGTGKSTIMQLLLKFYPPSSGVIKVANRDIAQIASRHIREVIAYVPQDSAIFSGTIRSNIIFARPDANEDEVIKVATITGVMNFIQNINNGLDAEIGEKGVRLSGGQKQRISLARALICNPDILLLDEAMSALDRESEQNLLQEIRRLMKGKILLSITHRNTSLEEADEIFVIDKGQLVARGTHNNLLADSKDYRIICQEAIKKYDKITT